MNNTNPGHYVLLIIYAWLMGNWNIRTYSFVTLFSLNSHNYAIFKKKYSSGKYSSVKKKLKKNRNKGRVDI